MSDEADCVLCRDLDPAQRSAMRADLIVIPLREIEHICDGCMEAFTANLFASFPKTEEEKMRPGGDGASPRIGETYSG
jgi:hypothetical protein